MAEKQPTASGLVLPDLEDPVTRDFWRGTAQGEPARPERSSWARN